MEESVSLTEALRAGAPEVFGVLYDEHAERLYAYCHIMIGDEAAETVRDAFIAAARHPATVREDASVPVWLHGLARAECVRRGALTHKSPLVPAADPLRRTLARLRPEHREALALSATFSPADVAQIIGVAEDTAEMLILMARRRLDTAAASVLGSVRDEEMLAALGGGKLHKLITQGYEPPAHLRRQVLSSCAEAERSPDGALLFDDEGMPIQLDTLLGRAEAPTRPMRHVSVAPTAPVVRLGAAARPRKQSFLVRRRDGLVEAAGLAACVAAATSVLALWPTSHSSNGASNVDGTSLLLHRGAQASRTVQAPQPPASSPSLQQGATAKAGTSPSTAPTPNAPAAPAPSVPANPDPAPPAAPSPPVKKPPHSHPTSPPSSTPTPPTSPTPTPTPTDPPSDSPTPEPNPS
jgi:DNA-directed RNA polymerase specialized sigma24 family protein